MCIRDSITPGPHPQVPIPQYPCAMEDLDRRIVELLSQDGRMSFTDLGKATGLSTSAVHQMVRRLEERAVIQGYRAVLDHNALGMPLIAFISVTPVSYTHLRAHETVL